MLVVCQLPARGRVEFRWKACDRKSRGGIAPLVCDVGVGAGAPGVPGVGQEPQAMVADVDRVEEGSHPVKCMEGGVVGVAADQVDLAPWSSKDESIKKGPALA